MESKTLQAGGYIWHRCTIPLQKSPLTQDRLEAIERTRSTFSRVVAHWEDGIPHIVYGCRELDAYFALFPTKTVSVDVCSVDDAPLWLLRGVTESPEVSVIVQAEAIASVKKLYSLSDAAIGNALGLSRPAVTNWLRLNKLDAQVRALVASGAVSGAFARLIAGLPKKEQHSTAKKCVLRGWSYRQLAAEVYKNQNPKPSSMPVEVSKGKTAAVQKSPDVLSFEKMFTEHSGLVTTFTPSAAKSESTGVLGMKFHSVGEAARIFEMLASLDENRSMEGEIQIDVRNLGIVDELISYLISKDGRV